MSALWRIVLQNLQIDSDQFARNATSLDCVRAG
jgi:hypothetical protein